MKNLAVAGVMTANVLRTRAAIPLKELARILAMCQVSALSVANGVRCSASSARPTLTRIVDQRSTAEAAQRLVRRVDGVIDRVAELSHRIMTVGSAAGADPIE